MRKEVSSSLHSRGEERRGGAEATAWRAGPCENRDVLNLGRLAWPEIKYLYMLLCDGAPRRREP